MLNAPEDMTPFGGNVLGHDYPLSQLFHESHNFSNTLIQK